MELTEEQLQFVCDRDPAFTALRADLRETINTTEHEMRLTIAQMLITIIPCLMPGMGDNLQSLTVKVPAEFLKSMLVFFQGFSTMMDQAEALQASIASARNASLN